MGKGSGRKVPPTPAEVAASKAKSAATRLANAARRLVSKGGKGTP